MAFAYLTIVSETANIELSALYILENDPPTFDMPSLNFKDDEGNEIESWDNPSFLMEFYQKLKMSDDWDLVSFLQDNMDSDDNIELAYILNHKSDLIELFQLAIKAGIFEEPNLQTIC